MKILFICCAGMSSSLVVTKLEKHIEFINSSKEQKINVTINAVPLDKFRLSTDDYDIILLAPQIAYKLREFQKLTSKKKRTIPVDVIKGIDYGLLRVDNILNNALSLVDPNLYLN